MTRKRLYEIVEVGASDDAVSRAYDFFSAAMLLLNITVLFLSTFDALSASYGAIFSVIEAVTVFFFLVDFVLRLFCADFLRPKLSPAKARLTYVLSFTGLVDLFSFLPYYLPFFFPQGAVAFRLFRLIRIFRLFRINAYYDAINVITGVLKAKRQQLISSVFIILVLMLAASLCMYSLEHGAQPEVFKNAFSGIWWAVSTLLTVGYGDIYPVTALGKFFSIVLTFLGVGLVAIPTGIISAGFVEQYAALKRKAEIIEEDDLNFIKIKLSAEDLWIGKTVKELGLPGGIIIAAIRRGKDMIVPRGKVLLEQDDTLILGAEPLSDDQHVDLQEIVLGPHSKWVGRRLKDLDLSRQTMIVTVKRNGRVLFPNGGMEFKEGDTVILYSKTHISGADDISV